MYLNSASRTLSLFAQAHLALKCTLPDGSRGYIRDRGSPTEPLAGRQLPGQASRTLLGRIANVIGVASIDPTRLVLSGP